MLHKLRQLREERRDDDRGFTLIELLVVVVIIGILIAIAIPLYLNYENGAKNKSAESDVRNAVTTVEQCITDNSNNVPAATAVTGSGSAGTDLVFTCGSDTQTAKVGSNNTLTYTPATDTYTIVGSSKGGQSYCYNSANGGSVKQGTTC